MLWSEVDCCSVGHKAAVDRIAWQLAPKERKQETRRLHLSTQIEQESTEDIVFARPDWGVFCSGPLPIETINSSPRKRPLSDIKTPDNELMKTLGRIPVGELQSLSVGSSGLAGSGICRALQLHGANLLELVLNGGDSGNFGDVQLQQALDGCTALRVLELHGVRVSPPSTTHGLQELTLGANVPFLPVEMIHSFPDLRLLSLRNFWPEDLLLDFFKSCQELRVINISCCIGCEVTNQMLACLISHTPRLTKFSGSRSDLGFSNAPGGVLQFPFANGNQCLCSRDLSPEAVEAFKEYFCVADVVVHWPQRQRLADAVCASSSFEEEDTSDTFDICTEEIPEGEDIPDEGEVGLVPDTVTDI